MSRLKHAVRAEWLKVFTTRAWWILGLVMVVYIAFTAALIGLMSSELLGPDTAGEVAGISVSGTVYSLGSAMGYLFPVLLGALSVTGEYRHHTLTPTFISVGQRGPVLAAKALVQAGMGAIYGVAALASAVLASVFFFMAAGIPTGLNEAEIWAMFARSIVVMALWAVIGVGLGALIRSQAGAIVVVLVFTQFIEPIARLGGAFNQVVSNITQFLPGAASDAFVGKSIYSVMTIEGAGSVLSWWQGGLVLAGYGAIILVLAWVTRWKADVS